MPLVYEFEAKLWKYEGKAAWYFLTIPHSMSCEIRELFKQNEQGWGRLKVNAQIGNTKWDTSIWFDTKKNAYLLPVKGDVRQKENLRLNDIIFCIIIT